MYEKLIYNVTIGDRHNYKTKADTIVFGIGEDTIEIDDVDQLPGLIAASNNAQLIPSLALELYDATKTDVIDLFGAQGVQKNGGLSFQYTDVDLKAISTLVRLHPQGRDNYEKDITLWKATIKADAELTYSSKGYTTIPISFRIFADEDQTANPTCFLGDWSIKDATPKAVLIVMDNKVRAPYYSLGAATALVNQSDRLAAFEVYFNASSTETIEVNNVAGYTDADIIIDVDAAAGGYVPAVGNVLQNNTGTWFYVNTVTVVGGGNYTLGIDRGTFTATATDDALIDGETLTLLVDFEVIPARDNATWTSSVPANLTVGDTYQADADADNKGVYVRLQAGGSNVTATVKAIPSVSLVMS